jgi:predicted DNA-binding antitoxin AbrB/MazE fold protein
MTIQAQAVYVQGTLRLLEPVGLSDNQQVTVLITEKEPTRDSILSDEEFDHLLDELVTGPPLSGLPAGFSRKDIYSDHD